MEFTGDVSGKTSLSIVDVVIRFAFYVRLLRRYRIAKTADKAVLSWFKVAYITAPVFASENLGNLSTTSTARVCHGMESRQIVYSM
jgi:hypothetical protein